MALREPLDPEWAATLLIADSQSGDQTVAQVIENLRRALADAVLEAQQVLDNHPFSRIVAAEAARLAGIEGETTLVVGEDGRVYVEAKPQPQVSPVAETLAPEPSPEPEDDAPQVEIPRQWSSELPSLNQLRQEALALGLDPDPYGRSKVKLKEALDHHRASNPPRKMMRTGLAFGPTTIVNPSPTKLTLVAEQASHLDLSSLAP